MHVSRVKLPCLFGTRTRPPFGSRYMGGNASTICVFHKKPMIVAVTGSYLPWAFDSVIRCVSWSWARFLYNESAIRLLKERAWGRAWLRAFPYPSLEAESVAPTPRSWDGRSWSATSSESSLDFDIFGPRW